MSFHSRLQHGLAALLAGVVLAGAGCASSQPYLETVKEHSWLSFSRPSKRESALQLLHADSLRTRGHLRKAANAYRALVLTWPASPEAPMAQLRLATVQEERGNLDRAFEEYEYLIEHYFGTFPYEEVLARQFAIAEATIERRRGKFLFFGGFKAPERAGPLFEKVAKNGPHWSRAPEAQYMVGWANELAQEYELAIVAYMTGLHRYPASPFAEKSAFGRARCQYRMAEESPNDAEALEQAWAAVVMYLNTYPQGENREVATAYRDTLLRRRAEEAYQKAVFYDKVARKPVAALESYEEFTRNFPNSEWTSLAQARMDALSRTEENAP